MTNELKLAPIRFSELSYDAQSEIVKLAMKRYLERGPSSALDGDLEGLPDFDVPVDGVLDEVEFDFSGVRYDEVAEDEVIICSIWWPDSRTSGKYEYRAWSLGDAFWYVTRVDFDDFLDSIAVIPKSFASNAFRRIQEGYLEEIGFGRAFYPAVFEALNQGEPWFLRAMTRRVQAGNESLWEHLASPYTRGKPPIEVACEDEEYVTDAFHGVVRTEGVSDDSPAVPGLVYRGESSPEYEAWLEHHVLRWKDSGDALDTETARTLRLVCLYLASS